MAMLPDCIAYDAARTGRRQAGVFTGLWTAGETFGLALGPGVYGWCSSDLRLRVQRHRQAAAQSDTAELGVLIGFTVLPAAVGRRALLRGTT